MLINLALQVLSPMAAASRRHFSAPANSNALSAHFFLAHFFSSLHLPINLPKTSCTYLNLLANPKTSLMLPSSAPPPLTSHWPQDLSANFQHPDSALPARPCISNSSQNLPAPPCTSLHFPAPPCTHTHKDPAFISLLFPAPPYTSLHILLLPASPCSSLHLPALTCSSLLFPALPCYSKHLHAPPCTSMHILLLPASPALPCFPAPPCTIAHPAPTCISLLSSLHLHAPLHILLLPASPCTSLHLPALPFSSPSTSLDLTAIP
jgi:hypothetical protein